jgi:Kef-type K+ transport system membrane component KefB
VGLYLIGTPLELALLLAGIATATDPATTIESIKESRILGKYKDLLEGIVGLDDALALVTFSILMIAAHLLTGSVNQTVSTALSTLWELGGAVLLGVLLGIPMAYLTGRIRAGEPTLVEAMGVVLLCSGLSHYLHVSYLIASVVLGYIVARWADHHTRAFHEIEDIEWPFIILFFVLTGASANIGLLTSGAALIAYYVVFRILGRIIGGWITGAYLNSEPAPRNWIGLCLLPQAGMATGLALLASAQFPELAGNIVSTIVVATIIFEVFGPFLTRVGLNKIAK